MAISGTLAAGLVAACFGEASRFGRPLPITGLLLPMFLALGEPTVGIPIVLGILGTFHLLWLRPVWRCEPTFTPLSWLLTIGLFALSATWYWSQWSLGIRWEGAVYTKGGAVLAAALACLVLVLGLLGTLRKQATLSLAARWVLLAWSFTYAFPYMGELP